MNYSYPKKIFVTGGAGYIGSHTCLELLKANNKVLVYDNLSNSSFIALKKLQLLVQKELNFVEGDIRNKQQLDDIMSQFQPDIVVHLAGLKSVSESIDNPLGYYDVNVTGSLNLLAAMKAIDCKKIIYSSSATVYGDAEYLPYDEKHPVKPSNPYGWSKLIFEQMLMDWVRSKCDNRAICLRYFNPVGAHKSGVIGEDPQNIPNNIMPRIARVALGINKKITIYGDNYSTRDGTCERDYIHVVDLAEGHLHAVEKISELLPFQTLNLGTGKSTTVKELISVFEKVSGKRINSTISQRRPGDIAKSWADPSLAEKLLGVKFERTLEDMCQDTWNWQKNNPGGYRM